MTYVKSIPRDESLTGANQAVQDAKSLAIPGIVFAASYETGVTGVDATSSSSRAPSS